MINPDGKFKALWDHLQMILIIYVATLVPFKFSFIENGDFQIWDYMDYCIDMIFFFDIIVTLNTPVLINNELITKRTTIFCNYLKTTLIFDTISVFPFDLIMDDNAPVSGDASRFAKFAKAPRLYKMMRITKLLRTLKMKKNNSNFISRLLLSSLSSDMMFMAIVPMYAGSLILAVIFCCIWHLLANTSDERTNWLTFYAYQDELTFDKFWASLYYTYTTFTTTGYGDIIPHTNTELFMTILMMVIGVILYSMIYSRIMMKLEEKNDKKRILLLK